jgi:hypothetical protein
VCTHTQYKNNTIIIIDWFIGLVRGCKYFQELLTVLYYELNSVAKIRQDYVNVEAGPQGLRPEDTKFREFKTDELAQIHKIEMTFINIKKKIQLISYSRLKRIGYGERTSLEFRIQKIWLTLEIWSSSLAD